MSKKQELYAQGLERLFQSLDVFLQGTRLPSAEDLTAEIQAIPSLKKIPFSFHFEKEIPPASDDYIILFKEDYLRYDDLLPCSLELIFLPQTMDVPKEINRFLTMRPAE